MGFRYIGGLRIATLLCFFFLLDRPACADEVRPGYQVVSRTEIVEAMRQCGRLRPDRDDQWRAISGGDDTLSCAEGKSTRPAGTAAIYRVRELVSGIYGSDRTHERRDAPVRAVILSIQTEYGSRLSDRSRHSQVKWKPQRQNWQQMYKSGGRINPASRIGIRTRIRLRRQN